jgi:hypothetical protein
MTQMSTAPGSKVEGSEGVANKSYIRHSTSYGSSGSTTSAEVCSCQSEWQTKEEQIKALQEKAAKAQWQQKPNGSHGYEGLMSLIQGMLRSMANMNMTCKPSPRVKQVWVKNDETIHPLRGSGLT